MNILIVNFFFIFSSFFSSQGEWKEVKRINQEVEFMTTDRLGNLYLVNNNFLWLYNSKGDSIASFNSRKYGDISYVDATDPYKILLFFSDYNVILFLDNYLSINGDELNLQEYDYDQVTLACQSREKGIWIFDPLKQKALHLDKNFKLSKQTVNLSQWFGKRIEPDYMMEYNNQLFILEKESGIYVFDHFGTYQKKIPINNIESFQLMDNAISFFKDGLLCQYDMKLFNENCSEQKFVSAKNMRIEKSRTYLLEEKSAVIFSVN